MNSVIIIAIAFVLILPLSVHGENFNERFEWNENRPLQWSDFKGIEKSVPSFVDKHDYEVTIFTHTWLEVEWSFEITDAPFCEYRITKMDTVAYVLPYESWINENAILTDYGLKHEQNHFDITQIYAKNVNALVNQEFPCPDGEYESSKIHNSIDEKFQSLVQESNNLQNEYDSETNGSYNTTKQHEWNLKISSLLYPQENKIDVEETESSEPISTSTKIPDWVKNIFLWYGQDQIGEDELLNAIKYLINEGILVVD